MAIEPEAFLLAACLLGVATVVRVASASVPFSLAAAAGDALVGLGITSAILLATGEIGRAHV